MRAYFLEYTKRQILILCTRIYNERHCLFHYFVGKFNKRQLLFSSDNKRKQKDLRKDIFFMCASFSGILLLVHILFCVHVLYVIYVRIDLCFLFINVRNERVDYGPLYPKKNIILFFRNVIEHFSWVRCRRHFIFI